MAKRRALGLGLVAAGFGYCVLVVAAYLHLTPPSSLFPDVHDLGQLLFRSAQPVSQIERLLEATGDMNSGGSMRPAFTEQSTGWEELIKPLSADQLATLRSEREAERLALLDWVRSGASQSAYNADDHVAITLPPESPITPAYLLSKNSSETTGSGLRIYIRTLISDRCVTCHSENGRHDTARFIPLDSYEAIAHHLVPDTQADGRPWLLAAIVSLFPLAALVGPVFAFTSQPLAMRKGFLAGTLTALVVLLVCWLFGLPLKLILLTAATLAAILIVIQLLVSVGELLGSQKA